MSTYRKTWDCCGDTSETESWEPTKCPFCRPPNPHTKVLVQKLRELADKHRVCAQLLSNTGNPLTDNEEGREVAILREAAVVLEKLSSRTETLKCTDEKNTSSTPPVTPPAETST